MWPPSAIRGNSPLTRPLLDLVGSGPVALDTCVFIYLLEENPEYLPIVRPMFERIDAGALPAVTSTLTLLETLMVPYRAGDRPLADRYEALLTRSKGLECVAISRAVLRGAAMLRAVANVPTPDAIQLATALQRCCGTFVTNDRKISSLDHLRVVQLQEFL